jgi:ribonuclease PH
MSQLRADGRTPSEARPLSFQRDFTEMAAGSVLVSFGRTVVLCTASVEEDIPRWLRGRGRGWVTAEYSMLPGSTPDRASREAAKGKQSGRTQEIQRLIGRSLRTVTRLEAMPDVPARRRSAAATSRCTTPSLASSGTARCASTR